MGIFSKGKSKAQLELDRDVEGFNIDTLASLLANEIVTAEIEGYNPVGIIGASLNLLVVALKNKEKMI